MKKKLLIALTAILVLAFAVPAFAALTDVQKQEILDLHKQVIDLRKQMIDKYVDSGEISADQGQVIKDRIDQAEKYRQENGVLPGAGFRNGAGNGYGAGCSGFGGGCGGPRRGGFGAQGYNTNLQSSWGTLN